MEYYGESFKKGLSFFRGPSPWVVHDWKDDVSPSFTRHNYSGIMGKCHISRHMLVQAGCGCVTQKKMLALNVYENITLTPPLYPSMLAS